MATKVLVTGATGFVGKALVVDLLKQGFEVRALVRNESAKLPKNVDQVVCGDLVEAVSKGTEGDRLLEPALKGMDVVIHTAARVHIMHDSAADPLKEFRLVNRDVSLRLAEISQKIGVSRYIYLSSIKVNGETSRADRPFSPEDQFVPTDPYGLSKYEAEQGLLSLASHGDMDVVIIRPPLVYGPGVRANFESMMRWIVRGIPLPLGSVCNQRSLVALDNLVSLLTTCANLDQSKAAANQVFLVSDGEDVSTTELLRKVGRALGKRARLIPVPVWLLRVLAKGVGRSTLTDRLLSNLQIDHSKATQLLGWRPVVKMEDQLKSVASHFLDNMKK